MSTPWPQERSTPRRTLRRERSRERRLPESKPPSTLFSHNRFACSECTDSCTRLLFPIAQPWRRRRPAVVRVTPDWMTLLESVRTWWRRATAASERPPAVFPIERRTRAFPPNTSRSIPIWNIDTPARDRLDGLLVPCNRLRVGTHGDDDVQASSTSRCSLVDSSAARRRIR